MPLSCNGLSDNDRFHSFKPDYAERSIANALESGRITPDDALLIRAYVAERQITHSIKLKRSLKIVVSLVQARRFLGPFRENKIPDLYLGIRNIFLGNAISGEPYSEHTRADIVQMVKGFYIWLIENEYVDLPEKKIRAIKISKPTTTIKNGDLLTPDEITALINNCHDSRDRAMIMTLYEGGFRIGEIGEMRWGHLSFDGTGVVANVTFKTGKPRYIRLVLAKEYLIKWKSDYPEEFTDDAFIFLSKRGGQLRYGAMARKIERTATRAGITKHIHPHIFRHSRITHLLQQGVSESVINLMMWGSVYSNMLSTYAHLAGTDIDNEIYKLYGIEAAQIGNEKIEPHVCPHCREINAPISKYCHVCGHPLDNEALTTDDDIVAWLHQHSDALVRFLQSQEGANSKGFVTPIDA